MNAHLCNNGHLSYSSAGDTAPGESAPCPECASTYGRVITDEQAATVKRLSESFGAPTYMSLAPFDLPANWIMGTFGTFTAGIAPNGEASS